MMFRRQVFCAVVAIMFVGTVTGRALGAERGDAIVVVVVRAPGGNHMGNAFFIGDGSLAVTARHVVFGYDRAGVSENPGVITLISPYLGDVCEARVVAEDAELDLVVLRTAWKAHPALAIAEDSEPTAASEMELESRYAMVVAIGGDDLAAAGADAAKQTQVERLPVDFVGMRQGQARVLCLKSVGKIKRGWSGCPILLPGTNEAAACLSTMQGTSRIIGDDPKVSSGFVLGRVRALLQEKKLDGHLVAGESDKRPTDADSVTKLVCENLNLSVQRKLPDALARATALMEARPGNAVFACWSASSMAGSSPSSPEVEKRFRKALELDPQSIGGRLFFAQWLGEQKRADDAMALLEDVRRTEPDTVIWAYMMANILKGQNKHEQVVTLMTEAVARMPNAGALWAYLGQSQGALKNHRAAVKSLRRATELDERTVAIRVLYAKALLAAGEVDEAEAQTRLVVKLEPNEAMGHVLLADFLAKNRRDKTSEAIAEAELALALPSRMGGVPKPYLESMISALKTRSTTQPQAPSARQNSETRPTSKPSNDDFRL